MELSEKIQKLRKDRDLTQEQLARQLYVSRTAVSKWETGRGIPSMESLQMIARFFEITLDELLGAEEIITLAEQENRGAICHPGKYGKNGQKIPYFGKSGFLELFRGRRHFVVHLAQVRSFEMAVFLEPYGTYRAFFLCYN